MKKIFKVFVCCHKYIHRVEDIKARINKWNLGDYLIFVGGKEEKELQENVIQLKCRDLYEDLPEKMFTIYRYLADNGYTDKYDYFWKIDDDVDFMRWNEGREQGLLNSLYGLDYCGFKIFQKRGNPNWHIGRVEKDSPWYNKPYNGSFMPYIDGGRTYFLSSKSVNYFRDISNASQIREEDIFEDLAVGKFLFKGNILPVEINPWQDKPVLKFNINK
jgi:hypothetical protein